MMKTILCQSGDLLPSCLPIATTAAAAATASTASGSDGATAAAAASAGPRTGMGTALTKTPSSGHDYSFHSKIAPPAASQPTTSIHSPVRIS